VRLPTHSCPLTQAAPDRYPSLSSSKHCPVDTHAVHALAELAVAAGDHNDGARLYLLALARDGYDEAAHRGLVTALLTAGRLGEARRAYARYRDAMREIDVEPIPMPARGLV